MNDDKRDPDEATVARIKELVQENQRLQLEIRILREQLKLTRPSIAAWQENDEDYKKL